MPAPKKYPVGLLLGVHVGWRSTLLLVAGLAIVAGAGITVFLPAISAPPPPDLRARVAVLGDLYVLGRVAVMLVLGVANLGLYTYLSAILHHSARITPDSSRSTCSSGEPAARPATH